MTMRTWTLLLGGLIIWAIHFFLLYGIAETIGARATGTISILVITLACMLGNAVLAVMVRRTGGLIAVIGGTGVLLSSIALVWQALPAIL